VNTPLDVEKLRAYAIPQARDDYDQRDVIIYALGVGAGLSTDVDETHFLFERYLQVLPTMALVLGTPGFWPMDPKSGLDWLNILHGEQRLKLFQPIDVSGLVLGETRITDLADKGLGKSALICATKYLKTPTGKLMAEATETWVVRGAGGLVEKRICLAILCQPFRTATLILRLRCQPHVLKPQHTGFLEIAIRCISMPKLPVRRAMIDRSCMVCPRWDSSRVH
jgi:N-terminal half of MaoC dehydratase